VDVHAHAHFSDTAHAGHRFLLSLDENSLLDILTARFESIAYR
jgi:hypothetical protein